MACHFSFFTKNTYMSLNLEFSKKSSYRHRNVLIHPLIDTKNTWKSTIPRNSKIWNRMMFDIKDVSKRGCSRFEVEDRRKWCTYMCISGI